MARAGSINVTEPRSGATPALVRWGAVAGGVVIGLSLLVVLSTLWLALAVTAGAGAVEANLSWFLAGSAIVAMFIGALLAGWLSGVPGFAPGFFNGLTVWGLILILSLAIGTPGAMQAFGVPATAEPVGALALGGEVLWAAFVSLIIGAIAAGLGGGLGGLITRPAFVYAAPGATQHRKAPRDEPAPEAGAADDRTQRLPDQHSATAEP